MCRVDLVREDMQNYMKLFVTHKMTQNNTLNQAQSEYKHSLTFRIRRCVVIATKRVQRLQIHSIVHN